MRAASKRRPGPTAARQISHEVQKTPPEYLPALLQIIRVFRQSITLKDADESLRTGMREALAGDVRPIRPAPHWLLCPHILLGGSVSWSTCSVPSIFLHPAREVAGEGHHFKLVQVPYNVRDEAALRAPTQRVGDRLLPALRAAAELGLYAFTSGTLLQGQGLAEGLAQRLRQLGLAAGPAAMLQVARSVPEIGTALVGMRRVEHVEEALAVAALPWLRTCDDDGPRAPKAAPAPGTDPPSR